MYEKIVNYFEKNLCVNNIYFRLNLKKWVLGMFIILISVLTINNIMVNAANNILLVFLLMLIIDVIIVFCGLLIIYIIPIFKIYKQKINYNVVLNWKGILLNEESLGAYQEMQIEEMERYLKKECKITNIETLDIIINLINEEIRDKYSKKSFAETWFVNILLPILICIFTIYFSNNNEQKLINISLISIISVILVFVIGNICAKLKNIRLIPINKKENLLDLKRVLIDIKIEWSKKKE